MTRAQIITYCTDKLGISDSAAQTKAGTFLDMRHSMIWNEADWRQTRVQQALSLVAGTQDYALGSTVEFLKAARFDGVYDVPILNDVTALQKLPSIYDANGPIVAIVPLARDSSGVAQIRVVGKPTQAGTLLLVGKKKLTVLGTNDEPPIPGEDLALCEFVLGDLFEWLRQFDSAAVFFAKGGILLQKMKELETEQASELRQIVPHVPMLEGDAGQYDSLRPLG